MTRARRIRQDAEEVAMRLDVESLAGGGYVAISPDVPGLVAQGRTLAETAEIAQDVARKILESCAVHGDPLPPAFRSRRARARTLTVPVGLPVARQTWGGSPGSATPRWPAGCGAWDSSWDLQAKGSHEIWRHTIDGRKTTLPRHPGEVAEGTVRAILRQAGVTPTAFLRA